ncbi:hypothetical protein [Chondrinema litorale]|uniref:hypothetical protein n=1 Tax=Chondrinema litorale TaxID=2994555 RepID=UPI002542CD3E|nr:hypothetical protein [Chondrinema litorale]UZR93321.1 hypothetical protein OQ292_15800 [Chondrinema litorale]
MKLRTYVLFSLCFFFITSVGTSCKSSLDRQRPVGQTWTPKYKKSKKKMKRYNSKRKKN